eukprot:TRINITY_DN8539_c0_g2_i1.p1 TRINITY_DN8539_c0_g2~~TRINITY_DN8539_c0_g2_i1.p1  ORF type:complete len:227 (+),score=49.80 TRINITY_DN8539_c0_g2_i1:45-725(+)
MTANSSMHDLQDQELIECQIGTTGGSRFRVQAKRSCKVWDLRNKISSAAQIPAYEQHLFAGNVKMRSADALSMFAPPTLDAPLKLTLLRSTVPDGISHALALLLWQGFRAFSRDSGETMDGARTPSLLRFAGLSECVDLLRTRADVPSLWTFPQCLAYVAELQPARVALPANQVEVDEGGDAESDTSSEDTDPEDIAARRFLELDLDLRCDARLMLRGRRNDREED